MKTVITYWGGKQKLASLIISLLPESDIYVEPFAGGGAVFFQKEPSKTEIINDLDGMIAIFYRVLRDNYKAFKKKVDATIYDRRTHRFARAIRDQKEWFSDLQIAWAFFALTGLGYSGTLDSFGCYTRGNKAKTFHGKKERFTIDLAKRLKGVQVENVDALDLIRRRDTKDTTFYLDPPYIQTAQAHYSGYTREMYRQLLDLLSNLKGQFLLSSFPNDVLDEYVLKHGWHKMEIEQAKPASKNPDGTKKRKVEVLVANYPLKNKV